MAAPSIKKKVNTATKVLNYVNCADFRSLHEAVERFIRNTEKLKIREAIEEGMHFRKPSEIAREKKVRAKHKASFANRKQNVRSWS